jgi:hypothetical protein
MSSSGGRREEGGEGGRRRGHSDIVAVKRTGDEGEVIFLLYLSC